MTDSILAQADRLGNAAPTRFYIGDRVALARPCEGRPTIHADTLAEGTLFLRPMGDKRYVAPGTRGRVVSAPDRDWTLVIWYSNNGRLYAWHKPGTIYLAGVEE